MHVKFVEVMLPSPHAPLPVSFALGPTVHAQMDIDVASAVLRASKKIVFKYQPENATVKGNKQFSRRAPESHEQQIRHLYVPSRSFGAEETLNTSAD